MGRFHLWRNPTVSHLKSVDQNSTIPTMESPSISSGFSQHSFLASPSYIKRMFVCLPVTPSRCLSVCLSVFLSACRGVAWRVVAWRGVAWRGAARRGAARHRIASHHITSHYITLYYIILYYIIVYYILLYYIIQSGTSTCFVSADDESHVTTLLRSYSAVAYARMRSNGPTLRSVHCASLTRTQP